MSCSHLFNYTLLFNADSESLVKKYYFYETNVMQAAPRVFIIILYSREPSSGGRNKR